MMKVQDLVPQLALGLMTCAALGCASKPFGPYVAEGVEFGYAESLAPEHWSELSPDFAACGEGMQQSPIDIVETGARESTELEIHYVPSDMNLRHDDHTVRVDITPGSYIELDGKRYDLKELHFHRISEHAIRGRQFPLEAHLIHESARGKLAIIAILIKYGGPNWELQKLLRFLPEKPDEVRQVADLKLEVDQFLGPERRFYRYRGSLSVPPCSEGVDWLVLSLVQQAAMKQHHRFRELVPGNYRPLQPTNGREIRIQSVAGD